MQNTDDTLAKKSSDHEYNQNIQLSNKTTSSLSFEKSKPDQTIKEKLSTYDLSHANHPIACIFTILFKALAIIR